MSVSIRQGDSLTVLRTLESESVQTCVTSPPYFQLRDYQVDGQIGLEQTPAEFIAKLVAVFDEVRRVLRVDGTCWVNLGSSYAGSGRGPTGKNGIGNQAKRQGFVGASATSDQSQSHERGRAPAYGSDGTAPSDCRRTDSSCSDLCDGCLADFLNHRDRTAGTRQPQQPGEPLPSTTDRDSERPGSWPAPPAASVPDALASTTLESWLQRRGECSRCAIRAASFSRLAPPPCDHDALACARTMGDLCAAHSVSPATRGLHARSDDTSSIDGASDRRTEDTAVDSSSYLDFTTVDHHLKPKDLILIPEMFALAMQARGWWVRSRIAWCKTSAMPESVADRPTSAWEHIWLFSKSRTYFYDAEAVKQPSVSTHGSGNGYARPERLSVGGRGQAAPWQMQESANLRNYWLLGPEPSTLEHYAAYPTELVKRCILAGTSQKGACPACGAPWVRETRPTVEYQALLDSKRGQWHGDQTRELEVGTLNQARRDTPRISRSTETTGWAPGCSCDAGDSVPCVVLDPFLGSGTTAMVADRLQRDAIGIELSPTYVAMARRRLEQDAGPMFADTVTVA